MIESRVPVASDKIEKIDESSSIDNGVQSLQEDAIDGSYGWVVIFAVFILNMHTWGLNSAFAVFLAYYLREGVFEEATPLVYAFVGGLSISIALLTSPLATTLVGWKRMGTRLTIFLGVVFVTISFVGASFATKFWQLLLSQGVSFGLGMGLCFVASAPVPPQWFTKHRSFATAVAAGGSGFGGLCYSLSTNAMMSRFGLPWTFRILAIICFVVNGIASFFIRDRNASVGSIHVAFNWKLFKRLPFLLFEGWLFFSMLGYTILVFSIVDYCRSVGLSASEASLVGALFNLAQGLGRPAIGLSSDKVGRLNISMLCTLAGGILSLFFWIFGARSLAECISFAILNGAVAGVMWATLAPVCAEVVGLALIPSALSMTWLVLVLPATFAEVIGISLKGTGPHSYLNVQLFTGIMYIGAFSFGWCLRAWKVHEMEEAHLNKSQQELAIHDDGVVSSFHPNPRGTKEGPKLRWRFPRARGLWAIQRV